MLTNAFMFQDTKWSRLTADLVAVLISPLGIVIYLTSPWNKDVGLDPFWLMLIIWFSVTFLEGVLHTQGWTLNPVLLTPDL